MARKTRKKAIKKSAKARRKKKPALTKISGGKAKRKKAKPAATKKAARKTKARPPTIGERISSAYHTVLDTVTGTDALRDRLEKPGTSETQ